MDGRAFDAIRGLPVTEALAVLAELRKTNLEHVSNKSAFLCGLIKTFRQKSKMGSVARNGDERINTVRPDEAKIRVCCLLQILNLIFVSFLVTWSRNVTLLCYCFGSYWFLWNGVELWIHMKQEKPTNT